MVIFPAIIIFPRLKARGLSLRLGRRDKTHISPAATRDTLISGLCQRTSVSIFFRCYSQIAGSPATLALPVDDRVGE